ncbi:MAG: DUF4234 domain-containing protein [Lachnospiraceae bacterium]|nr:DUF4234 domain-containing protein [Candidatus Colinaster scatohippi]
MRKKYDFIPTLLLSIVTCGIYALIMWADMSKNLNELDNSGEKPLTNFWLTVFILAPITCGIYEIIWMIKFFQKMINVSKAKGITVQPVDNAVVLWILMCVPIYSFYVLCEGYNNAIS